MRRKCRLWLALCSFLALLCLSVPQSAVAAPPNNCDNGKFDNDVANNRAAWQDTLLNVANNINKDFPVIGAQTNACIQTVTNLLGQLGTTVTTINGFFSNPGDVAKTLAEGVASALITQIVSSVINAACNAATQALTNAQNLLTSAFNVCLPIPDFGLNLQLPSLNGNCATIPGLPAGQQYNLLNYTQTSEPGGTIPGSPSSASQHLRTSP